MLEFGKQNRNFLFFIFKKRMLSLSEELEAISNRDTQSHLFSQQQTQKLPVQTPAIQEASHPSQDYVHSPQSHIPMQIHVANQTNRQTGIQRYEPTIFVSIPSYRDVELQPTILDILQKAKNPQLLTLAINQQLADEDKALLDIRTTLLSNTATWEVLSILPARVKFLSTLPFSVELNDYRHRRSGMTVKVMTMSADSARGPMLARALIEQCLYTDERWKLDIDSHMCFVNHFDQLLNQQYDKAADFQQAEALEQQNGGPPVSQFDSSLIADIDDLPKIVLTCYPYDYVPNRNMALRKPDPAIEKRPPPYLGFKTMHQATISKYDLEQSKVAREDMNTGDAASMLPPSTPLPVSSMASSGVIAKVPTANVLGYRPRSDKHALADSGFKYNAFGTQNNDIGPSVAGLSGQKLATPAFATKRPMTASAKNAILQVPQQDRLMYTRQPPVGAPLLPSLLWAACFSFGPASMMKLCPYDPYCSYVFIGEEYSMALRLYSHGFRLYAPNVHIVYHLTTREYRPTYWEQFHEKTMYDLHAHSQGLQGLQGLQGQPGVHQNTLVKPRLPTNNNIVYTPAPQNTSRRPGNANQQNPLAGSGIRNITIPQLKPPKLTQQERIERKYMEQQGYTRLYDLIINGSQNLYVPKVKHDNKNNNANAIGGNASGNPNDNVLTLDLDENDAQDPKYSLGPYATLADFQKFTGIYVDLQKYEKRAALGLTAYYKGTAEEMFKQPLLLPQSQLAPNTNTSSLVKSQRR